MPRTIGRAACLGFCGRCLDQEPHRDTGGHSFCLCVLTPVVNSTMLVLIEARKYLSNCILNSNAIYQPGVKLSKTRVIFRLSLSSFIVLLLVLFSQGLASSTFMKYPPLFCISASYWINWSVLLMNRFFLESSRLLYMTPLAFFLTLTLCHLSRPKWTWGREQVWKSSWLARGLIQRNNGWRRLRK